MSNLFTAHDWATNPNIPDFLRSYEALAQHFRGQLQGLPTTVMGDKFAQFVRQLIPQTDIGPDYETPELRAKKSNDEGVDLLAKSKADQSHLYVQAKLWLDRVENVDTIVSKFQAFSHQRVSELTENQTVLQLDEKPISFMVVTLSPLSSIIDKYARSAMSSKTFYNDLVAKNQLKFVDGHDILRILRAAYIKTSELPTDLILNLELPPVQKDNVYLSIIASVEIQRVYSEFGDALFFENVRDFLGLAPERTGRTSPNQEIVKTIQDAPSKMLERNNGIVIRAEAVIAGDNPKQIVLTRGSIVNGCQTTMCIVENATNTCFIPIKIVQTSDSWDIAKAANYQNAVDSIDLDLARHLRPQLAKRIATAAGVQIKDGPSSAFQILETIYDRKVAYDETRLLYIGIFSKSPNNVFSGNYTELVTDLITKFYEKDPYGEGTFSTLFSLQSASQEGLVKAEETFTNPSYADKFKRFYRDDTPTYRSFISILALCAAVEMDITDRKIDTAEEYVRMRNFLQAARSIFDNRKERFIRLYVLAVKTWMQEVMPVEADDPTIQQKMNTNSKRANFTNMYRKLCMEADFDEWLRNEKNAHPG
jgi:hypothetical protein